MAGSFGVDLVQKRSQSNDWSKLGREPLGDVTYQIVISDKKLFFSIEKYVTMEKHVNRNGPHF